MKYLQTFFAAAVLSLGLMAAVPTAQAGTVDLPCYPNCGPVCVPGGTMKCD